MRQDRSKEELLYTIGITLSRADIPYARRLDEVVHLLSDYFGMGKCSLMMINYDDLTLEVKAATNPSIVGCKRQLSEVTIATRALLDDKPFHADGKRRSFFSPQESSKYISEYSLSIPIKYNDKKLGVINFTDSKSDVPFTEEQEQLAVEIIELIAPYFYASQTGELLEAKVGKLEEANKRLLELDDLKTNLTHFIVHDLKGPIATVMANLDLLSYEELTPQQFEYLNLAIEDIYKMQRMVLNILDVLKLEEGKIKIFREDVDIYELAHREASSFRSLTSRRNIELVVEGDPYSCFIDENLIGRTISNLLLNAIEHSPDGGTITLKTWHDEREDAVCVSIADCGTGIPEEMREKIFDKFFQIKEERKQRKATTGLGLTFCKLVVEAHKGALRVEEADGGGAKFILTLPERLGEKIL